MNFASYRMGQGVLLAVMAMAISLCPWSLTAQAAEPSPPATKTIDGQKYTLSFHDEFNGDQLDAETWIQRAKGPSPKRMTGMWFTDKASYLDGKGNLVLAVFTKDKDKIKDEAAKAFKYRWIPFTSMLRSRKEFKYGYYEFRLKMPIVKGLGMSVWMQSKGMTNHPPATDAKDGTEIDLIEQTFFDRSGTPIDYKHTTVHWGGYAKKTHQYVTINVVKADGEHPASKKDEQEMIDQDVNASNTDKGLIHGRHTYYSNNLDFRDEQFHTVSMLWTPEFYKFYYDGELIGTIRQGVSHAPEYIILWPRPYSYPQLMGDSEKGLGDLKTTQANYLVDYVRIYQLTPSAN